MNWVLLSDHGWGSGAFMHDTLHLGRPTEVHFPAYQQSQLLDVRLSGPHSAAHVHTTDAVATWNVSGSRRACTSLHECSSDLHSS